MKWSHPMTDVIVEAPDETDARRQFRALLNRKRLSILPEYVPEPRRPPVPYDADDDDPTIPTTRQIAEAQRLRDG